MLKKLTIKQLLLLAFLLAGLLPAMLVSLLSFYQTRNVLKAEIQQDMQALSMAVSNDLERMMLERMRNVRSWSQLSIMQEAAIGDIDKRLAIFLNGLADSYDGIYKTIYVEDMQGRIIASSQAQHIGQIRANRQPWFETKDSMHPLVFSQITDNTMAISQVMINENNLMPMATLVAEFNWETVVELLNHAATSSTAVALEDTSGSVLASTNNWREIRASHGMDAKQLLSEQAIIPRWQVHVEKLRSVAIAPVHRLGYIFLALLLVTILFSMMIAKPIAQAITQPIAGLTAFVRGFTRKTKKALPQSGPPEVRELGIAFEKMMRDLEKSQSDLTRAAKLAVVGEMAAAMSHEVRTPLGILRSSANVLKREASISEEGKEVLTFIDAETERMNKLVSTLIDAARPKPPTFTIVNLVQLIQNTMAILRTKAEEKQIQMSFETMHETVQANVDADQMTQVMMNLMMNAIQVLTSNQQLVVSLSQDASNTVIAVMDNGDGIAPEDQSQIFESFFTKRAGGVGLGLAIVRQIVHAHDGEISYQQSTMGGAQFTIVIPNYSRDQDG